MVEIELYAVIDAGGDYAVGNTAEAAREKYEEDIGELNAVEAFRTIKIKVCVPLPEVVEMVGQAPAQGTGSLVVSAA